MAKKRKLKTGYVSKGERPNVSKKIKKLKKVSSLDKMLNIQKAFVRGITDPWVTIKNPENGTKEEYIKIRYSIFSGQKAPKRSLVG